MDDVAAIVSYLRTKPTGATLAEARAALRTQVLDGRKLSTYRVWGFVEKTGDRMKLAELGWELARNPESAEAVFRQVVAVKKAYSSVLEWAYHQKLPSISTVDVAHHWHEHHVEEAGTLNENTLKDAAVCFFNLGEAAGLGKIVLGRRKENPTRLALDEVELRAFVDNVPADGTVSGLVDDEETFPTLTEDEATPEVTEPPLIHDPHADSVFITHSGNMEMVAQVETLLSLADLNPVVAEKEETHAIPVPQKVLNAMHKCAAGIMIVTADDTNRDQDGVYALNHNVSIEIGAAFVLYEGKIVLLWDKRVPVPSNLQGLYRCEFEGDELSLGAGMKLMQTVKSFRTSPPSVTD